MARLPRFVLPGHPQHVIVRGNNREPIFLAEEDYRFYLDKLKDACIKHRCDVHAYVLMTNHVHLLMTPHQEESISKVMQMLGRYTFNTLTTPTNALAPYGKVVTKQVSSIVKHSHSPVTDTLNSTL